MTIAREIARWALGLKYGDLPPEVVHAAKRSLLDTFACAVGAAEAPAARIAESVVRDLGGPKESTVFGSGLKTSVLNATLVNGILVRFLDANDAGCGGHASDRIPSVLAVCERNHLSGQEFLAAMVVAYELGGRISRSLIGVEHDAQWQDDTYTTITMSAALGKVLGLNEEQIENAIGCAASGYGVLGILDANNEVNTMTKNLRCTRAAYLSLLACLLAQRGYTGPGRIIEGERGVRETISQNKLDLERLVAWDDGVWGILEMNLKSISCNGNTQGHVSCTLSIVTEQNLKPEDIAHVRIRTGARDWRHTANDVRKFPKSKETADHSAFYTNAIVIKEHALGPEQYAPEKFDDPVVLDLIANKITVEPEPSYPEYGWAGSSEITTVDGRTFFQEVLYPKGHRSNPMSDQEIEAKFRDYSKRHMTKRRAASVIDAAWNVDKITDVNDLTRLMVFR